MAKAEVNVLSPAGKEARDDAEWNELSAEEQNAFMVESLQNPAVRQSFLVNPDTGIAEASGNTADLRVSVSEETISLTIESGALTGHEFVIQRDGSGMDINEFGFERTRSDGVKEMLNLPPDEGFYAEIKLDGIESNGGAMNVEVPENATLFDADGVDVYADLESGVFVVIDESGQQYGVDALKGQMSLGGPEGATNAEFPTIEEMRQQVAPKSEPEAAPVNTIQANMAGPSTPGLG